MNARPGERAQDPIEGCLEACRRCDAVVVWLMAQDPAAYRTVGPHLRHCLDHYQLFLDGWPAGEVDYDDRARDERAERDPEVARQLIRDIAGRLALLNEVDLAREIAVRQSAAPGRPPLCSRSRLDRELVFLSSHTIHHIAIMILASREAGVVIPAELGVAFSTEAHRSPVPVQD